MGRLKKSKIEEIIQCRLDGDTQEETAEKVDVNIKTVQKYDPLHKSRKVLRPYKNLTADLLEHYLKCLGDWTDSIITTLRFEKGIELMCPHCMEGKLTLDSEGDMYSCVKCGYLMPLPSYVWGEESSRDE
jgi:Zn ribbon nucleic-acid-binding protein